MTPETVLGELTGILGDTLGNDSIKLTMSTVRSDIHDWDSFNYILFMVAVEKKFAIKFTVSDIEEFPNVGAIVEKIIDLTA